MMTSLDNAPDADLVESQRYSSTGGARGGGGGGSMVTGAMD